MSVKNAQNIALKFDEAPTTTPPRGLGPEIENGIHEFYNLAEEKYRKCFSNEAYPTNKAIKALASGGSRVLLNTSIKSYLHGNLKYAAKYAQDAIDKVSSIDAYGKAECYYLKSRFLAEGGDFIQAKYTISLADSEYSKMNFDINRMMISRSMPVFPGMFGSEDSEPFDEAESSNEDKALSEPMRLKLTYASSSANASVKFAMGDMEGAKNEYKKALVAVSKLYSSFVQHVDKRYSWKSADLKVKIAQCFILQGNLAEAEIWVRDAFSEGNSELKPYVYITLSKIYYEQGKYDYAEKTARTAVNMIVSNLAFDTCLAEQAIVRAEARQILAKVLLSIGKWNEALEQLNAIKKEMSATSKIYNKLFSGSIDKGLAFLMAKRPDDALKELTTAKEKLSMRFGSDHYSVYESTALIGIAKLDKDQKQEALELLDSTIPELIKRWQDHTGGITNHLARFQRLEHIIETYIDLISERGLKDDIKKALIIASAFQTRKVGKSIAASFARSQTQNEGLTKLIRDKQDLELQVSTYQNLLVATYKATDNSKNRALIKQLEKDRDDMKKAVQSLTLEINNKFPSYTSYFATSNDSVENIQNHLSEEEALISIFIGEKATYTWSIRKNGEIHFNKSKMGRNQIDALVSNIRSSAEPDVLSTVLDVHEFDLSSAFKLYQTVFFPVKKNWESASSLLVVTNGPLDQIPISLRPTERPILPPKSNVPFLEYQQVKWIIRTHAITQIPSINAFVQLRKKHLNPSASKLYAGFGDPWFNKSHVQAGELSASLRSINHASISRHAAPNTRGANSAKIDQLPRLHETAIEVREIARALGADPINDIYTGKAVSETKIKQMKLSDVRVLAFATHGLVSGDLDGLNQPALALSSPAVTGETGNDGLLTMGEIMWLRLNADWVILSACNTASADGEGAEAVSGIGQAFFYAGAKSLLVTNWSVETNSAMALTTGLFSRMGSNPGMGRSEALRLTQLSLIDNLNSNDFSYAHPFFWAPFSIIGEGSTAKQ